MQANRLHIHLLLCPVKSTPSTVKCKCCCVSVADQYASDFFEKLTYRPRILLCEHQVLVSFQKILMTYPDAVQSLNSVEKLRKAIDDCNNENDMFRFRKQLIHMYMSTCKHLNSDSDVQPNSKSNGVLFQKRDALCALSGYVEIMNKLGNIWEPSLLESLFKGFKWVFEGHLNNKNDSTWSSACQMFLNIVSSCTNHILESIGAMLDDKDGSLCSTLLKALLQLDKFVGQNFALMNFVWKSISATFGVVRKNRISEKCVEDFMDGIYTAILRHLEDGATSFQHILDVKLVLQNATIPDVIVRKSKLIRFFLQHLKSLIGFSPKFLKGEQATWLARVLESCLVLGSGRVTERIISMDMNKDIVAKYKHFIPKIEQYVENIISILVTHCDVKPPVFVIFASKFSISIEQIQKQMKEDKNVVELHKIQKMYVGKLKTLSVFLKNGYKSSSECIRRCVRTKCRSSMIAILQVCYPSIFSFVPRKLGKNFCPLFFLTLAQSNLLSFLDCDSIANNGANQPKRVDIDQLIVFILGHATHPHIACRELATATLSLFFSVGSIESNKHVFGVLAGLLGSVSRSHRGKIVDLISRSICHLPNNVLLNVINRYIVIEDLKNLRLGSISVLLVEHMPFQHLDDGICETIVPAILESCLLFLREMINGTKNRGSQLVNTALSEKIILCLNCMRNAMRSAFYEKIVNEIQRSASLTSLLKCKNVIIDILRHKRLFKVPIIKSSIEAAASLVPHVTVNEAFMILQCVADSVTSDSQFGINVALFLVDSLPTWARVMSLRSEALQFTETLGKVIRSLCELVSQESSLLLMKTLILRSMHYLLRHVPKNTINLLFPSNLREEVIDYIKFQKEGGYKFVYDKLILEGKQIFRDPRVIHKKNSDVQVSNNAELICNGLHASVQSALALLRDENVECRRKLQIRLQEIIAPLVKQKQSSGQNLGGSAYID